VVLTNGFEHNLLTSEKPKSEQECSVQAAYSFTDYSMQFCPIESLDGGRGYVARVDRICGFPFHRRHITGALWLGGIVLPMAA
jgi:hypothetical protein